MADIVFNGEFENWSTGTVDAQPDGWLDYESLAAGTGTNNRESTEVKYGTYSLKTIVTGINAADYKGAYQAIQSKLRAGVEYTLKVWIKNALITNGVIRIWVQGSVLAATYAVNEALAHGSFTRHTLTFTPAAGDIAGWVRVYVGIVGTVNGCSGTVYVDSLDVEGRAECGYCGLDDIKCRLGEQWSSQDKYDDLLTDLILSASRLVDRELHWPDCHFAAGDPIDQTRYFDTAGGLAAYIPRCILITTLKMDQDGDGIYEETWVQNTDFVVWPYDEDSFSAIIVKEGADVSFPVGQRRMQIVGKFGGYDVPPQIVKEACAVTVVRSFKRGMQAYQDMGGVVELGQLIYTKALDPDVQEMLRIMPRRHPIG